MLYGALTGLPFILLARLMDRGGLRSRDRSLFAVLTGFLAGNIMLQLHCPNTDPLHLLFGHGGVLIPMLLMFVGLRMWMRIRRT